MPLPQNREEELQPGVVATMKRSPARLAEDSIRILSSKPDHEISLELENVVKNAEVFFLCSRIHCVSTVYLGFLVYRAYALMEDSWTYLPHPQHTSFPTILLLFAFSKTVVDLMHHPACSCKIITVHLPFSTVSTLQEFSYAHEFYKQEGVTQLLDIIKRTPIFESMNCSILAHSLQALCLVMEYMGTELWTKMLDNMAIKKVVYM